MQMKVFNKGQIVIPARIRRSLGIEVGDRLEVELDCEARTIKLHKPVPDKAGELGGVFANFAKGKELPSREQMSVALREGMLR